MILKRLEKEWKLSEGQFKLVPLRYEDIFLIKDWRNAQIDILRQVRPLTDEDQEQYYREVVEPSFQQSEPKQILFSYLKEGKCIGYGGLVHISWKDKRAEVSFLLNPQFTKEECVYADIFSNFLTLIKECAFEHLGLNRLFTETYNVRPNHIRTLEKNGFLREGKLREHTMIEERFVDSIMHGFLRSDYEFKR